MSQLPTGDSCWVSISRSRGVVSRLPCFPLCLRACVPACLPLCLPLCLPCLPLCLPLCLPPALPLVSHLASRCLCFHSVSILSPTVSIVTHSVFHVIKVASEQSKTIQISMCPMAPPIFLKALLHVLHAKSCSTSVCLSQIQNFESYISFQNWIAKLDGAGP